MYHTRITGCVITLNEEGRIAACLDSLAPVCDELLVVDAHSSDRTREIAAAHGARVIERDWPGYRSQKQFAVDSAAHDWILSLDADERLSPELAAEITRVKLHGIDVRCAYDIPFLSSYYGLPMRHGDWHPDRHIRLFDRRRTRFGGEEIHEKVIPRGPVGKLQSCILHDSYRDLDHQLDKLGRYASLVAVAMEKRGRRAGAWRLFAHPLWRFVRAYIVRRGYLDGWRGLVVAQIEANYVWEKYLRLYIASRLKRVGRRVDEAARALPENGDMPNYREKGTG